MNTLAVSGTTVFAGGLFSTIGGQTRNNIAALDATSGTATTWDPNAGDKVNTLAVSGTTVYAGGWFTTIGGQTRNRIAALDATSGTATTWNPNANGYVVTPLTGVGTSRRLGKRGEVVGDLEVGRRIWQGFGGEPEPAPKAAAEEETAEGREAQAEDAVTAWATTAEGTGCAESCGWEPGDERVVHAGADCDRPEGGDRQDKPVTCDAIRSGPAGVLPLPTKALERAETPFNPDAESVPGDTDAGGRQIRQKYPWTRLTLGPHDDQRPCAANVPGFERGAHTDPGVTWSGDACAGRLSSCADGRKRRCVTHTRQRMPVEFADAPPQSWTPQTTVGQHQHGHPRRHRGRQNPRQPRQMGHPRARLVGGQDRPGHRQRAPAVAVRAPSHRRPAPGRFPATTPAPTAATAQSTSSRPASSHTAPHDPSRRTAIPAHAGAAHPRDRSPATPPPPRFGTRSRQAPSRTPTTPVPVAALDATPPNAIQSSPQADTIPLDSARVPSGIRCLTTTTLPDRACAVFLMTIYLPQ